MGTSHPEKNGRQVGVPKSQGLVTCENMWKPYVSCIGLQYISGLSQLESTNLSAAPTSHPSGPTCVAVVSHSLATDCCQKLVLTTKEEEASAETVFFLQVLHRPIFTPTISWTNQFLHQSTLTPASLFTNQFLDHAQNTWIEQMDVLKIYRCVQDSFGIHLWTDSTSTFWNHTKYGDGTSLWWSLSSLSYCVYSWSSPNQWGRYEYVLALFYR